MIRFNLAKTIYIAMIFVLLGCDNSSDKPEIPDEKPGNIIQISQDKFVSDKMKIGESVVVDFADELQCSGYIQASVNGIAEISSHISGTVEAINYSVGDHVKKGQILSKLSGKELIMLQQEFIETSSNLKNTQSDFERTKILFNDKIGSEKEFMAVQSQYQVAKSQFQSLKLRLELLNLDIEKIKAGNIYSEFPVIAPISGHITNINLVLGQFVETQSKLFEIVDINKLQLQLSVFEKNISKLSIGQDIRFNSPGAQTSVHIAELVSIEKTIDPESKTILCKAKIKFEDGDNFINRSYVEANIIVNRRPANALPSEAIIASGKDSYVYIVEKIENDIYYLRKETISIGSLFSGYAEIMTPGIISKVINAGASKI
ncbi:MAG: efflux RND transporter periplasmic adaptor subunit [Candidatus Kapabacteria bacterium]|nr:efflux RND transporter periplasmic adaptor subunit [Candidatus Kapabacteria bacterium]